MRIAARRKRELLCAMMEMQELEWLDMDEVEADEVDVRNAPDVSMPNNSGTPTFSVVPVPPVWTEGVE